MNGYEGEKLEIVENPTNGQFSIKGLTSINIKHMNDLYDLLSAGVDNKRKKMTYFYYLKFSLREKAEAKGTQISNRAHTVFFFRIFAKILVFLDFITHFNPKRQRKRKPSFC